MFFVSDAYAMAGGQGQAQGGGGMESIIMLLAMFAIFYFLLIRPQQKRAKQHKEMVDAIKAGDQVVTVGGVHGKVVSVQEKVVNLEIATGVRIVVNRTSIAGLVGSPLE
jgi:preprotein translocase subunit YajC